MFIYRAVAFVVLAAVAGITFPVNANVEYRMISVCPFCSSINPTIAEQLDTNDVVVVVRLKEQPPEADIDDTTLPKGSFEITKILKGKEFVSLGDHVKSVLIGQHEIGDQFMMMGVDVPDPAWSTPIRTNQRVIEYFERIPSLPTSGPDRLAYFQEFFEDEETVLANDAYDEFALASYEDVIALKERMHHDKLIGWLKDEDVLESRKRLYFTMLGVCGDKGDVEFLEEMLAEEDRDKRPGLDAMVACYLRIQGAEGLPFIEKIYLANKEAEYIDVFSVIQALRFHSTETEDIPKERIAQSLRLVLDHPKIADIVIPDLARLKDWSVIDRLDEMFRRADGQTKWIRTPIASYFQECPLDRAKELMEEYRKIDPEAVERAELMANYELFDDEEDDEELESDDSVDTEDSNLPADDPGREDSNKDELSTNELNNGETQQISVAVNPANSSGADFVTTGNPTMSEESENSLAQSSESLIQPQLPVANSSAIDAPLWAILGIAVVACAAIFMLLWSVICGWFERIIV